MSGEKNFEQMCRDGFYWCKICDGIAAVEEAGGYFRCVKCRGVRLKFYPPVNTDRDVDEQRKSELEREGE